ncbi:Alpha-ketoglutarate-dependent taurine dioxygenase [Candidatus Rhodobacter oscarellae]|uniref:Alpha-ketoglutarate-dependent taurine dioxygenase n=1 Tax=Candidatus Rhodobacter oscarellae TaxID=1675527 RepID=A0A0J9GW45_9RHOB|nr:TauD/TfdA family dioxygenase [Candidatus Rhodobacter lobularis]KMW57783.1 Alpha-ketoglutarate-dependent taurine dioxygenase [Candidatus Rhodobacter lobularis]
MRIEKLTPAIGAVLHDVDIAAPDHEALYQALLEHLVIFIRGTEISPRAHLGFAQGFGDLSPPHPVYPHVEGHPQIMRLANGSGSPPDTNSWHTDLTFKAEQPFASVLVARTVPDCGGDTIWSSNYAAYDRLPDGMRRDLEALEAVHDMGDFRNNFAEGGDPADRDTSLIEGMARMGQVVKPLIGAHPVTGAKFLNYNVAFVSHILGLTTEASNALKTWLTGHMNQPEDQVRWRWRPGDLAMWDNRVTMHYAVADYLPAPREMHRITVIRDRREGSAARAAE